MASEEERTMIAFAPLGDRWGVSTDTVRRLADDNYLRTIYIAGRRLVPMEEVLRAEMVGVGRGRKRVGKKAS